MNEKLNDIAIETKKKMRKDGRAIYSKDGRLTDLNENVCEAAIILRELIMYCDWFDDEGTAEENALIRNQIQALLSDYGLLLDGVGDRFDTEIIWTIEQLLDKEYAQGIMFAWKELGHNEDFLVEKALKKILIKYYRDYEIPTDKYDNIVYEHIGVYDICDTLKHHYKCLHNPKLKWDNSNQYDIQITFKEMKDIILEARDSGGHLDFAGDCHDGTTINCIVSFLGDKYNIAYNDYYQFCNIDEKRNQELEIITEEIYRLAIKMMPIWRCTLY